MHCCLIKQPNDDDERLMLLRFYLATASSGRSILVCRQPTDDCPSPLPFIFPTLSAPLCSIEWLSICLWFRFFSSHSSQLNQLAVRLQLMGEWIASYLVASGSIVVTVSFFRERSSNSFVKLTNQPEIWHPKRLRLSNQLGERHLNIGVVWSSS